MVLIVSEEKDQTTNLVIDWLDYYGINFKRINPQDHIILFKIDIENQEFTLLVNQEYITSQQIKGFWYRRGFLNFRIADVSSFSYFETEIRNLLHIDRLTYSEFIFKILKNTKRSIGDFLRSEVNKLHVLQLAQSIGLKIPPTIVTTSKNELINFQNINFELITKSVGGDMSFYNNQISAVGYTSDINEDFLSSLPKSFGPTLFQKKISKKYEIRSFFLNGKFFSMAVFSQNDPQTKTDFRNYNWKNPNRCVAFTLPNNIAIKLYKLMECLSLDTGSIDIIVDLNGDFIFLEVNPVGQFGMVSIPCNFKLEREIAVFYK